MRTKEEILTDHLDKETMDSISVNIWPDILEAMEAYRNQFTPCGEGDNVCSCAKESECGYRSQTSGAKSVDGYLDMLPIKAFQGITQVFTRDEALKALTAQAQDHASELKEIAVGFFSHWYHNELSGNTENAFDEWIVKFRSSRTGEGKEGV